MEAPEKLKVAWIAYCGINGGDHGPFAPLDMAWFMSCALRQTTHQVERQAERDPVKALMRIRSAGGRGLHPLFGPPMAATTRDDRIVIAAHDVCVVAKATRHSGTLLVITTLPMKPRGVHRTFGQFVKFRDPAAYRRHIEALADREPDRRRRRGHRYRAPRKTREPWM